MLASGIMGEDAGSIRRIISCGAGAIVTKSIGLTPRDGYPNPTVVETPHGLINAMGLPNPGIHLFRAELENLTHPHVPLIGSIFGATPEEFSSLAQKMNKYGAHAVELNLSCPHAQGYGSEIGADPENITKIVRQVKHTIDIPVFVKLSPNVTDIVQLAVAAQEAHADAIVAINTVKAMAINLETRTPVLANKSGGYSGEAIKPIGVRCVYDISKTVKIPVIGVGGITTGEDVIEYIMAGATAVQIGTAVYERGVDVFTTITKEMGKWMTQHHVKNILDLRGVAHL